MAALQGPSRAQAAQALDFALEPKGSPCTRALGWPGWSLEGIQPMLTMARLTVALLPTNMLRGMLHGEGDKPAAATSAAARHARLRCEEHARLHGGACEAHRPFTCSTYAFACQYRASTRPAHSAHAARLLCGSQPIITLVAALAVTRVAWATVRATGGRSEVAARSQAHDARGCSLQLPRAWLRVAGCRLRVAGCSLPTTRGCKLQGSVAPCRSPSVVASQ